MRGALPPVHWIIPVYRPDPPDLRSLLSALSGETIIIVRNYSGKIASGRHTVLGDGTNRGYAAAANTGMTYAYTHGAVWALVVNQDLKATRSAVTALKQKLTNDQPMIAGPFAGSFDPVRYTTVYPAKQESGLKYISGSCIAVHIDLARRTKLFYEPYFLYYEDADLCLRAAKAGFPVRHLPVPGFSHTDNQSVGGNTFLLSYYLARNHMLFIRRNAPTAVVAREIIRMPLTLLEHHRRGEIGAVTGIRDFALGRFGKFGGKL
ncbi:hypothetical protein A2Z33_04700 [Candidatus Gottesmanbacteria bacterium RBG_16_52_11]|uniref:Glycosyltransferase 2-like domain-containing protein n=1 Tax=Candidatus Gottesmanbacteria bacterium RBG_16_52_11 TaxID=1798374 RepID=A0A1F5YUA6_9BACT|nr:MAG: hypothetical protein A2Z33_04700 [Candidatus Gottesmanbacteria bacterium RBG_16_52_11]